MKSFGQKDAFNLFDVPLTETVQYYNARTEIK